MNPTSALLHVKDLRVYVPGPHGMLQAVRGVNFSLAQGQSLGLMGESGCGKSLTALALMGLLPQGAQASGEVWFQGRNVLQLNDNDFAQLRGNRMAMIFQEPMTALNPVHTIGDQVAEPLRLHQGMARKPARARAAELLARVGIAEPHKRLDAYPHQFSGGQRQRIMMAMALACQPELLIADEPTTALDVTVAHRVLELLHSLAEENGMGLVLISHDLGVMARHVQRLLVMYGGQVMEDGLTPAVLAQPAHPYTQGLMASRPQWGHGKAAHHLRFVDSHPLQKIQDADARQLGFVQRARLHSIPGQVPALQHMPDGCPFADRCWLANERCAQPLPAAHWLTSAHSVRCWNKP